MSPLLRGRSLMNVVAARIRGFLRPGVLDRELGHDFDEEIQAHLAMAEADKIRQGMTPAEARRAARIELGGMTQLRESTRDARGLPWLDSAWLDIKLGLRMLRKSWGLTLVAGLAMTIAIAIGVVIFTFFDLAFGGALPLDEGERVVGIQIWDDKTGRLQNTSLDDLERWRGAIRSVEDLGAFRTIERNLILAPGDALSGPSRMAEPVLVAEMTASGFNLARVRPLLGRTLVDEDERVGAAPVVVIGYDAWQARFQGDTEAIGRTVRLGDTVHTVVGVMPEGFSFPVNHSYWTSLRGQTGQLAADQEALVFARLAPGFSLERAQAELTTVGILPPEEAPLRKLGPGEAEPALQASVVPYTFAFTGASDRGATRWIIRLVLLLVTFLLIPPCANIAILVYARTITRQEEFAARYALGASRGRIVSQLFVEMLVLAQGAAFMALLIVGVSLQWAETNLVSVSRGGLPFWMDFSLSYRSFLFASALAVVAALIAGLVPALKATGRQMRAGLHALGNRTGMQLGRTWAVLVVVQVALSLAALPAAVEIGWGTIRKGALGPGFAAEQYLAARLTMDRPTIDPATTARTAGEGDAAAREEEAFVTRFAARQDELVRRLEADPGILSVTVASLPGDEPWQRIEVESVNDPSPSGSAESGLDSENRDEAISQETIFSARSLVRVNHVDDAFFDVFDIPLLSGRGFETADFDAAMFPAGRNAVVVNRAFVLQTMGSQNPLGRRFRYIPEEGREADGTAEVPPWLEIVGVVEDRPANVERGTIYRPATPGQIHPTNISLRLASDPTGAATRLREVTTALDPTLRLDAIQGLDEMYREKAVGNNAGALSLAAVTLSVLLLSAAGMYALLSFTVNRRRREIGIRSALGAQPQRLLINIFGRAMRQFAVGSAVGVGIALLIDHFIPAEMVGGLSVPGVIPAATALMLLVGGLAAIGPARRGMQVEPIEELREG